MRLFDRHNFQRRGPRSDEENRGRKPRRHATVGLRRIIHHPGRSKTQPRFPPNLRRPCRLEMCCWKQTSRRDLSSGTYFGGVTAVVYEKIEVCFYHAGFVYSVTYGILRHTSLAVCVHDGGVCFGRGSEIRRRHIGYASCSFATRVSTTLKQAVTRGRSRG